MGSRTKRTWKQSSRTVTRPSSDCQTTFFGRFKQFGTFLKKVPERSRDSGRRSRNRRPTVKQRFWLFQATRNVFEKSHWTVTRQWLRSRDRRPTVKQRFLDVSSDLGKFWKKSLNGHATVLLLILSTTRSSSIACNTRSVLREQSSNGYLPTLLDELNLYGSTAQLCESSSSLPAFRRDRSLDRSFSSCTL